MKEVANFRTQRYIGNMDGPFSTRAALLQVLMEREGYGLQLIERIKTLTKGKVVFSQGNVYPVLRELERAGLVTSREGEVTEARGGRPRIYYRITAEGLRAATDDAESVQGIFGLKPQTSGGGDV